MSLDFDFDFANRNTSRIGGIVAAIMVMMTIAVGGVAAVGSPIPVDGATIEPTNDTESIYVDVVGVSDFNGSSAVDVDVTLTGYNSSNSTLNDTQIDTQTLSVTEGNTSSYNYDLTQSDIDDYDNLELTVEVVTSGDEDLLESVDWGALQAVGGAGGSLSLDSLGSIAGIPIAAIVALVGLVVIFGRGD